MILSHKDILPLVHNALKVGESDGGLMKFYRFTPKQSENYYSEEERFGVRSHATANITLDFLTDSDTLGLSCDVELASSQYYYTVDLFVDGVLFDSVYKEEFGPLNASFSLPSGTHRVTVFFPWTAELFLKYLSLSDGAFYSPVPEKKLRIIALGDSITQGYIAKHPGMTWVGKVTRDLDAEVLNLGIGGYGFRTKSLEEKIEWTPDLIALAYGTNDYAREVTEEGFIRCASEYIEKLTAMFPGVPVLLLQPIFRNDANNRKREAERKYVLNDARRDLREIAKKYPQITVMEDDYFPHTPEFFAPDYLHPNDQGFLIQGERTVRAIKELCLARGIAF